MRGLHPHRKFLKNGTFRLERYRNVMKRSNVPIAFQTERSIFSLKHKSTIEMVINKVAEYNCFEV